MDISVNSYNKFSSPVNFGAKMLLQGKLENESLWKNVADGFEKASKEEPGHYIVSEDDEYIRCAKNLPTVGEKIKVDGEFVPVVSNNILKIYSK